MKHFIIITALLNLIAGSLTAQTTAAIRKKEFNIEKSGLAIQGYDPVAYFTGKAKEGNEKITASYNGLLYRFASVENQKIFNATPEKYEPQYGGWCAYAMGAKGEKVEVDPETFKIINGKLYLFYNKFFNNTLKAWNKDEARLKTNADINWKKIIP
ncbi:YHS domain-containing (seleno)protein [Foetidibacter luteolus]|uniref:YHS domain-containing (seleno)protein n=1 Tax=Foetidibacter luteolus TaxID=2608880 RepID=UPI00129A2797|nr:YHS domain-containing (seleno)protein [Foetidibacter luteolus]